jgi:hypothetical protein
VVACLAQGPRESAQPQSGSFPSHHLKWSGRSRSALTARRLSAAMTAETLACGGSADPVSGRSDAALVTGVSELLRVALRPRRYCVSATRPASRLPAAGHDTQPLQDAPSAHSEITSRILTRQAATFRAQYDRSRTTPAQAGQARYVLLAAPETGMSRTRAFAWLTR